MPREPTRQVRPCPPEIAPPASATAGSRLARRARPDDAAAIVRLIDALNGFHQDPTGLLTIADIRRQAFADAPVIHVAVSPGDTGDLVGVAVWEHAFELAYAVQGAYLSALWVDPDYRRQGRARAMLDHAAADVEAAGGSYLWWVSQPWNKTAHATYQRFGAVDKAVRAHALIEAEFSAAAARGRALRVADVHAGESGKA